MFFFGSIGLLILSNIFMLFAWYGHLKEFQNKPFYIAALISWGIALFEYFLQVPANRIGYRVMDIWQLKILQEIITLAVFVPFSLLFMQAPFKMSFIWAAFCLIGAVYFIFK